MAKYGKVLAWVGPILLPMVIAGIRGLLEGKNRSKVSNGERESTSERDMLDTLVDAGLSGLTRGKSKGRGR